jgi:hypothetical protein
MPSSFSPSLRLELIAPGEQAGTWGTTTNTNLGTLIESSVAGFQTVSVIAADQALTIADGAADQSRSAMLRFTTTTGAAFNVYAPPVSKQYVVFNDSAHAVTLFNSTSPGNTTPAGAGVAIPAGRTIAVWSNGTAFRVQTDFFLGNLTGNVTGNLTGNVTGNLTGNVTGNLTGNVTGNLTGNVTGNASTATALQTARTIGGVSFDGTANINLPGVNAVGNQNTTGNAATATNATNATNATKLVTTGFTIEESGGELVFKNGTTVIASLSSTGVFTALSNVTAGGTP